MKMSSGAVESLIPLHLALDVVEIVEIGVV
ncbi:protein of unknown function [Methylorubrum extorquens]|uniref:Uncharacterized protein n=1 Tax=Methylorubrum extorquens TaxID=408 RepID=A0A2N9AYV1_METEX|nr:protein of unknown function [Methylorubrum extorquens]